MIYSKSGLAEEGCVFQISNEFGSFQWIITKHDLKRFEIQFVKFIEDKMMVLLDIHLEDGEADSVSCNIRYIFTALKDEVINNMHEAFLKALGMSNEDIEELRIKCVK